MDKAVWTADEAVAQMDSWGEAGVPFAFYCDYTAARWHLMRLDDSLRPVSESGWYFSIDTPTGCIAHLPPVRMTDHGAFLWQAEAPERTSYAAAFEHVMAGLRRGDSFLTNLTWRVPIDTSLTLERLFLSANAPFRLYVPEGFCVCSPEPFIRVDGTKIATYPMKGTCAADSPDSLDGLLNSPKEKAEHATIVDLMRNDLSQVAHDVHVTRYRYAERIDTPRGGIWQTSSEIVGTVHDHLRQRWGSLLLPLLPAGSITGAPKHATQQLIAEAEPTPRGYYTGIMGLCTGEALHTAVMIRYLECHNGHYYFRAGGGITAQSECHDEWHEVTLKAQPPMTSLFARRSL